MADRPRLAELDVEVLTEALHAQFRLHRPGSRPMGDAVVRAMASFIATEYARLAAQRGEGEPDP